MSAPHVPSLVVETPRGMLIHPAATWRVVELVVARLTPLLPDPERSTWSYRP